MLLALGLLEFLGLAGPACAALLSNPSFETVPDSSAGQGLLPSDYFNAGNIGLGADTYSSDDSYGLSPGAFGNFPGAAALDGIRFVAGAENPGNFNEAFGQTLSVPLMPGSSYTFTASIRERLGGGFVSGGYELLLSPSTAFDDAGAMSLGLLDPTTGLDDWEFRSLTFLAPANALSLPNFILAPYSASSGEAYIAIDDLSLALTQAVPEPSSLALGACALAAGICCWRRRRRVTRLPLECSAGAIPPARRQCIARRAGR
ncbi:MAG: hypothetical protein AB7U20_19310 [Planctomycetaceae bacterium]